MNKEKRYIVTQHRPQLRGLIETGWFWQPILNTDNLKLAFQCQTNWKNFTGYKTVIADCAKSEVIY